MNDKHSPAILCPACEGHVSLHKARPSCPTCGKDFSSKEGFFDLLPGEDFYWGEITRDLMQSIVRAGHEKGYEHGLSLLKKARANTHDFVTRHNRADWGHLIPDLPIGYTAVDLGSGWGSIALPLSKKAGHVISIEATRERAEWQQLCKEELNITNLHVIRGNILGTKLPSNSVDLIVANGLVEWIGLMNDGPVNEVFCNFLTEIMRMLKPTGYFYCGIENRYMINSFFGMLDHSGYRYTNLMPRWMANLYCRIKKPAKFLTEEKIAGYRTYTYSYWAWESFLQKAGYSDITIYGLLPSYNNIEIQSRLDKASIYRYFINTLVGERTIKRRVLGNLGRLGGCLGIQKLLHPHFGVLARKPASNGTLQKDKRPDLVRSKPHGHKIISFLFDNSSTPICVRKTVRYPDQEPLLEREIESLKRVEQAVGDKLGIAIPKILGVYKGSQGLVFEQEVLDGAPLSKTLDRYHPPVDMLHKIEPIVEGFSILEKMARLSQPNAELARSRADAIVDKLSKIVNSDDDEVIDHFQLLLASEIEKADWTNIACIPQHGDFSPSNILVDGKKISSILDWEYFDETGLPLMDSLFFALTCAGFACNVDNGKNSGSNWLDERYSFGFKACFLEKGNLNRAITMHVKTICDTTGMNIETTRVLLPLFLADIATRFVNENVSNSIDSRFAGSIKLFMNTSHESFFKERS